MMMRSKAINSSPSFAVAHHHGPLTAISNLKLPFFSTQDTKLSARVHPNNCHECVCSSSAARVGMNSCSEQSILADVLQLILTRVDQSHRLTNCALVSKIWRTAAAAATTQVNASVHVDSETQKAASLWRWLRQHGRKGLNQLAVFGWTRNSGGGVYDLLFDEQLQLPQLQHLSITGRPFLGLAIATPSNNESIPYIRHQNPFAGMPGLTSLILMYIEFGCSSNGLAALALLTQLQAVELWCVQLPPDQLEEPNQQPALVPLDLPEQVPVHPISFQQLTQLTSLTFDHGLCGRNAVAPLSCLHRLQSLHLNGTAVSDLGVLQGLPQSLTHIRLRWAGLGVLSSSTAPSLAALTGLQQLDLTSTSMEIEGIHPSLLSGMQQLHELKLAGLARDALPALLEVMPVLRELRVLDITDDGFQLGGGGVQPLVAGHVEQYSKLLPASSQLSSVRFSTSNSRMLAQQGCMQAVFNPARQLDSLRELVLDLSFPADAGDDVGGFGQRVVFDNQGLRNMASCCPNLAALIIPGLILPGSDKSILLQWKKSLTSLAVGGIGFADAWVAAVLINMTNLRELAIIDSPDVSDLGLLSLTALTKLRDLTLADCGLSEEIWESGTPLRLPSRGDQPEVWVQVQDVCRHSNACWRYVNQQLAQQKAATQRYRQLLGSARAQAAAAKAKLRRVCERLQHVEAACKKALAKCASARQSGTEQAAGLPVQEEGAESEVYAINWSEDDYDRVDEAAKIDNGRVANAGPAPEQQQQQP